MRQSVHSLLDAAAVPVWYVLSPVLGLVAFLALWFARTLLLPMMTD